eukprot:m.356714 g.356714  ORF g.356714 m.356714 type:complete len:115 (+) comp16606_c0_seq6:4541-4885(+)
MSIEEKFHNFKAFVKEVSRNNETIQLYEDMTWFKLQAMGYTLLLPHKDKLDDIVKGMQEKLDFDDEHSDKFKRYMELFIEYLGGELETSKPPEYITSECMSFEERMAMYMKENL